MLKTFRTRPFGATTVLPAMLLGVFILGACGDDGEAKAKESADVLSDYYYRMWQPPSPDWEVRKVRPGKDIDVTVEAKVVSKGLTRQIMARSRMEQMEIARMACPAYNDKIWSQIGKKQTVGIMLSGSAGHIIKALCKRP